VHAIGGVGPLHVAPVPVPAVHVEITDATVGLGPFTVPPISIPSLPIASITGSVDLAANTISPIRALDPLAGSIGLFLEPFRLSDPFITIDAFQVVAGVLFLENIIVPGLTVSGQILVTPTPIPLTLNLDTTPWTLFPNGFTIPAQTPVTVGMEVANDGFTFFPGGLTFPRASAGVTGLSVGLDAFTLLPDGFTLDTVPATFDGTILIGDIPIPIIDVPAVPGFGNTTTAP
ncbi:PPE family protein, partial [Mycobacterium tuberculosis]